MKEKIIKFKSENGIIEKKSKNNNSNHYTK